MTMTICRECAKPLTAEEAKYYETRCENCEREWGERIEAWRKGGEDGELDLLYSVPPPTSH